MRQTVIGMFDNCADAWQAAHTLQAGGFGNSVRVTDEPGCSGGRQQPPDAGVVAQVRQFFARMFGAGPAGAADQYAETVLRGGAVLWVEIEHGDELDRVRETLRNAGATEIEEQVEDSGVPDHQDRRDLAGLRSFASCAADFRDDFETWYRCTGSRYEDYEPAYRYGHALAHDPAYAGRKWEDFEPDARRQWERLHPRQPWQRYRTAVRHAWQHSMA